MEQIEPGLTYLTSSRVAVCSGSGDQDLIAYDFDGTNWAQVGNALDIQSDTPGQPSMATLTSSRIAFLDQTNDDLRTYNFDGTDWSQMGDDLPISSVAISALAGLTENTVAMIDITNKNLRTYEFI